MCEQVPVLLSVPHGAWVVVPRHEVDTRSMVNFIYLFIYLLAMQN